jgi:hypothetical protein
VDINHDGVVDGVAVDVTGDGVPDGVDTNGDGMLDEVLPPLCSACGRSRGPGASDAG